MTRKAEEPKKEKQLQLRVNAQRAAKWVEAANQDRRSLSTWARTVLNSAKPPSLAGSSHEGAFGRLAIYYTPEERKLWEARALIADLELTEYVRRALDRASGQR